MKSSKNNPLVSVIIPTKNNIRTIQRCLQSVKDQSYINIELIVVDNHSNDGTLEIAKKFTDKVYTKGPERSAQRNFGFEKTEGNYLLFADSDMYLGKKVVQECVDLSANNRISAIYIPEVSVGKGFWAQCKQLERSFYADVSWMNAARFFSKKNYLSVGGYDKKMISGEDWDLSQRLEKIGGVTNTKSFITHDEGTISLLSTVKKKFYYATKFSKYLKQNKNTNASNQTSIIQRYFMFLKHPFKLFRRPLLGFGVLFMKTCEFLAGGIGYLLSRK